MRSWKIVVAVVVIIAAVGTLAYVRSDEEPASAEQVLEVQRYCELSAQLEGLLTDNGIPAVGALPDTVPPETVRQVLTEFGPASEELERVVPPDVRSDVQTVLGALRRAADGEAGATSGTKFTDARTRIAAFRQKVNDDPLSGCPQGGGSGDS